MAKLRTIISDLDCPQEFPHINLNLCESCLLQDKFQEAVKKADEAMAKQIFNNNTWAWTGSNSNTTANITAPPSTHAWKPAWDTNFTTTAVDDLHFTYTVSSS